MVLMHGPEILKEDFALKYMVAGDSPVELFLQVIKMGLFECALALFTFGRLDVIPDIIGNVSLFGDRLKRSRPEAYCLYLLPLPDNLNPLEDTKGFLIWFSEHSYQIEWDGEKNRFFLNANIERLESTRRQS